MAKITKEEVRTCTKDEALSIIKNADGRVRFMVGVSAFLPVNETQGFEGYTCLSVSRSDAMTVVRGMLSDTLEARGARIKLHLTPPDPRFTTVGGLSFIRIG